MIVSKVARNHGACDNNGVTAHFLSELLSFLDGLPEPRIVMDADYRIVAANAAYVREVGGQKPLAGRACYEVSHHFDLPCDQAGESCPLKQSLETGEPQRVLRLHHTPRGEEHVAVETTPIRDDQGQVVYFVETMRVVRQASSRAAAQGLVGRSPAFVGMLEKILRVANSDAAVVLLGETGTGKELVARAIHEASAREEGPFVAVDCASLTETLLESELFGYEKGAFTGATQRKQGLVEAANGGTLFLDEIGDLPPSQQVKLLRLLESGTFRRVGGISSIPARFRVIAATHRDLAQMVRDGSFRAALYYRLAVFPLRLPPLRERQEDIPLLAEALLARVAPGRDLTLAPDALAWLLQHPFPGNIRELRNLLERASLLCDGDRIQPEHRWLDALAQPAANPDGHFHSPLLPLAGLEQRYLAWALASHRGDRASLAAALGMTERTLYRKLATLADLSAGTTDATS